VLMGQRWEGVSFRLQRMYPSLFVSMARVLCSDLQIHQVIVVALYSLDPADQCKGVFSSQKHFKFSIE
jgi:hypothetical protein